MKILLILENSPLSTGGIELHCRKIMELYKNDPDIEMDYLCKDNVKSTWNKWVGKVVFDFKHLMEKIQQSQCDIVHVHGFASMTVSQGLRAALSLKKPVVYTAHFHPFFTLNRPMFGRLFFHFGIRPYLSQLNTVVAINNEDRKFFQQYNRNVVSIPHWITGIEQHIEKLDKKQNMILFVGRNSSNKGLAYLNKIPAEKYDIHCVTNSDAGLAKHINVHIDIDNVVLNKLYYQAALVVVPSKYEAFSYVALEALERGTPVLMSNRVRIADHLSGVKGWNIFEYGNTADFFNKIDETVGLQVDKVKVEERFSEAAIKQKFDKIYKQNGI